MTRLNASGEALAWESMEAEGDRPADRSFPTLTALPGGTQYLMFGGVGMEDSKVGGLQRRTSLRIVNVTRVWHARQKTVLERWTHPKHSRRTCSPRHGLPSCRGKSAGVAKRPRERSPTRKPFRYDSPLFIAVCVPPRAICPYCTHSLLLNRSTHHTHDGGGGRTTSSPQLHTAPSSTRSDTAI
jgi:hypothetical protein